MLATKTQRGQVSNDIVSVLLFSSMLNPAEEYLSKEAESQSKSRFKALKDSISAVLESKLMPSRKKAVESSLENEIDFFRF
mgnify:CR=1 FL=1